LAKSKFALLKRFPVGGGLILFIFIFTALFAPLVAEYDPVSQDLTNTLQSPVWEKGGNPELSLVVGFLSVLLALVFGTWMGLMAGFFGGRTETIIMRLTDMQLAMPYILMAIAIIGALGPSTRNIIIVLAICNWATYARLIRGEVLSVKQNEFVELAVISGAHTLRILFLHILPNVVNTLIVMATLDLGRMIIFEGALSFLGLGVQPPAPSWGNMLADGRAYLTVAWHLATFPGLAIMLVVLGTNLFGDWLRDVLDPKRKQHMAAGE
jgi:peptide/nickel transport system permease protein